MKKAKKLLSEVFALAMMLNSITVNVHAEEPATTEEEPNVIVEEDAATDEPDYSADVQAVGSVESSTVTTYYALNPFLRRTGDSFIVNDIPDTVSTSHNPFKAKTVSLDLSTYEFLRFETSGDILSFSEDGKVITVTGTADDIGNGGSVGYATARFMDGESEIQIELEIVPAKPVDMFYITGSADVYVPLPQSEDDGGLTPINNQSVASPAAFDELSDQTSTVESVLPVEMSPADATVAWNFECEDDPFGLFFALKQINDEYVPFVVSSEMRHPCNAKLTMEYLDQNGVQQTASINVHVVENLPLPGEDSEGAYAIYPDEDGVYHCAGSGDNAVAMTVDQFYDFEVLRCKTASVQKVEDGNTEWVSYPYYPSLTDGYYGVPYIVSGHNTTTGANNVIAMDSFGHITAANPGTANVLMSCLDRDWPVDAQFEVIVSNDGNGDEPVTVGEDTVNSWTMYHLDNDRGEESHWTIAPAENPTVYNCINRVDDDRTFELYELVMKRSTTGQKFTKSDAQILADMEAAYKSVNNGDMITDFAVFDVYSYNTEITVEENGLSSETTVRFYSYYPGDVELRLDDNTSLMLRSIDTYTGSGIVNGLETIDQEVLNKIGVVDESMPFGISETQLRNNIPSDAFDSLNCDPSEVGAIVTDVECKVDSFEDTETPLLSVDLSPVYTIYSINDKILANREYEIVEGAYIRVKVDDLFPDGTVYIRHTKDDGTKQYLNGNVANGILSFWNEDGFSKFEISQTEFEQEPSVALKSLVLSGDIGINFYMDLPEISGVDYAQSYMDFTISGKNGGEATDLFDAGDYVERDGKNYYNFTCHVNVLQMAEQVNAVFHYGDNKTVTHSCSVKDYINAFEKQKDRFSEESVNLVHAIADYGYYSQQYLSRVHGFEIGKDYAAMDVHFNEYDETSYDAAKNETSAYALANITKNGVQGFQFALDLKSSTSIILYITPTEGNDSLTVEVNDQPKTTQKLSDGRYMVKIENISGHKLANKFSVKVITESGESTVDLYALSYAYGILNNENSQDDALNCVTALYHYYDKNIAYRNQ